MFQSSRPRPHLTLSSLPLFSSVCIFFPQKWSPLSPQGTSWSRHPPTPGILPPHFLIPSCLLWVASSSTSHCYKLLPSVTTPDGNVRRRYHDGVQQCCQRASSCSEAIRWCGEDSNASLKKREFATMAANDFCGWWWHLPKVYMLGPLPLLAREEPSTPGFAQHHQCCNNSGPTTVVRLCWASAMSSVLSQWPCCCAGILQRHLCCDGSPQHRPCCHGD